jgi:hypothetical protein
MATATTKTAAFPMARIVNLSAKALTASSNSLTTAAVSSHSAAETAMAVKDANGCLWLQTTGFALSGLPDLATVESESDSRWERLKSWLRNSSGNSFY